MSSINKVILVGRFGQDPEKKESSKSGEAFATFSIATNKKIKEKEITAWHKCVSFDPYLTETILKYAKAGTLAYLEGELNYNKWTDKDGNERVTAEIVLGRYNSVFRMLSNKDDNGSFTIQKDDTEVNSQTKSDKEKLKEEEDLEVDIPI